MIQRVKKTESDHAELIKRERQNKDAYIYNELEKSVVPKPWGHEYLMYRNPGVEVWHLYLKKGEATSLHCHPNKKTALILLSGTAQLTDLKGERTLSALGGVIIDAGAFHKTRALSAEGIHVIEVETPPDKNDLIRLKDEYGRVGKGYEKERKTDISDGICFRFHNSDVMSEEGAILDTNVCIHNIQGVFLETHRMKVQAYDLVAILSGTIVGTNFEAGDLIETSELLKIDKPLFSNVMLLMLKKENKKTHGR